MQLAFPQSVLWFVIPDNDAQAKPIVGLLNIKYLKKLSCNRRLLLIRFVCVKTGCTN
jgi:hypothetical protein